MQTALLPKRRAVACFPDSWLRPTVASRMYVSVILIPRQAGVLEKIAIDATGDEAKTFMIYSLWAETSRHVM
jgi:hypothetical protein